MNNLITHNLLKLKSNNIIIELYQYYYQNGLHSIMTDKIVKIMISYSLIFIINLLVNCIDYKKIINPNMNEKLYLYDFIILSNWFPTNPYLIICFSLYCLYLISLTINLITSYKKIKRIKKIYNDILNISDNKLKFISWDEIVNILITRLKQYDIYDLTNINIYTMNNKICNQSNIIISLIRSNILTIPKLSTFLEWNLIYCIIDPLITLNSLEQSKNINMNNTMIYDINNDVHLLDNKELVKKYDHVTEPLLNDEVLYLENSVPSRHYSMVDIKTSNESDQYTTESIIKSPTPFDDVLYHTFYNKSVTQCISSNEYINKVKYRTNLVLFLNIVCLPFIIPFVLVYFIIKYGEHMYSNSSLLFERQLSIITQWQLRYYNELPNLYKERLYRVETNLKQLTKSYTSELSQILIRFLIFSIGSIFIILLVLSFIANTKFSQLEIIQGHTILWFLGVMGTFLLLLNKLSSNNDIYLSRQEKQKAFELIKEELITIHSQLYKSEDREYIYNILNNLYYYRIYTIFNELIYIIKSPYYIWKWKNEIVQKGNEIINILDNHLQLGLVAKHSIFTNVQEMQNNSHMLLSYKEFMNNHNFEIIPQHLVI